MSDVFYSNKHNQSEHFDKKKRQKVLYSRLEFFLLQSIFWSIFYNIVSWKSPSVPWKSGLVHTSAPTHQSGFPGNSLKCAGYSVKFPEKNMCDFQEILIGTREATWPAQ